MDKSILSTEYDILNIAASEYLKTGVITLKCPRCGNSLVYEIKDSLEIIRCKNETCIKSIRRGL